ncbi:MAG: hypothetical protein BalsKO_14030 [Balneolaceae bacterium]
MNIIIQILRQLSKKWYLWLFIPVFAGVLVFYLTGKGSKQYVSESSLFLNLPTSKGLSITNEEFKQHEISTYIQDLVQLSRSNKSLEYVKLNILKGYLLSENTMLDVPSTEFPWTDSLEVSDRVDTLLTNNLMLDLTKPLDAKITMFLRDQGITNKSLNDMFNLYREGSSNYLRLKVTTADPFESAYVAEKIIETLMLLNKETNKGRLEADQMLFEKLMMQAKVHLDEMVKKLEDYKIKHNVINLPEHTKAIVNQMVQLEVQKAELVEMMASKKEGIIQIKSKLGIKEEIPVDLSKNSRFIELQNKMREITTEGESYEMRRDFSLNEFEDRSIELNTLLEEYVSDVPIDIRKARQELIQSYLNYQVELEMSRQLIPLVDAELKRLSVYARTLAPLESNIGTIEREITTAQETYLILVNKLNLAKTVAQSAGMNELAVIDSPNIPLLPIPSKRKILILASIILCFIIVIVTIAALEYLDSGIWSSRDYLNEFGIEPFSVIPDTSNTDKIHDEQLVDYLNVIHVQQVKAIAIKIHAIAQNNDKEVVLLSSLKGEGKEELAKRLAIETTRLGYGTRINIHNEFEELTEIAVPYSESEPVLTITILPPTAVYSSWKKWLKCEHIFIWMFHAGRAPLVADTKLYEHISDFNTLPVLVNVQPDYLEDSGASVIRKRSFFRIWIKRILTLQFKAKRLEMV